MEGWRRRVNEALDELLAAQIAESAIQKRLKEVEGVPAVQIAALRQLWRARREAATAAMVRVEAILWE